MRERVLDWCFGCNGVISCGEAVFCGRGGRQGCAGVMISLEERGFGGLAVKELGFMIVWRMGTLRD